MIFRMLLNQILKSLNEIAPLSYAQPWDNVGLLAGDPAQIVTKILLTIDYTAAVAAEARDLNCDFIIAYHPPLFSAVKRITADGPGHLIHDAIRRGVAIYSPHTAWDAATGGTNDLLAEMLGLVHVAPLQIAPAASKHLKLITFVPEAGMDAVTSALFNAGAGHIGRYSSCSFQSPGTGTFFGNAGTHPAVGQPGKLEKQPEIRLETIIPVDKVDAIVRALLKSHPYEEPAYDLNVLAAPTTGIGQGRVGSLPTETPLQHLLQQLKDKLQLSSLLVTGPEIKMIHRIAICAGAGGELLDAAINTGADLFLTGELRHHDAIKADRAGVSVLCTLHSNCERPSLTRLKSRLEQALAGNCPPIVLSQSDRDPFSIR
jgi:dinuclear metal center YbgI/SA1388 family protein